PPHTLTLLPYTTLFRSPEYRGDIHADFLEHAPLHDCHRATAAVCAVGRWPLPVLPHEMSGLTMRRAGEFLFDRLKGRAEPVAKLDRKSTRLNSSHQIIS